MKKLALILAVIMCFCTLAVPASAVSSKGSYGKVPTYKGTITIDGKVDDIYKQGLVIDLAGDFPGNYASDATGKAYVLHDGKNIYIAMEVNNSYPLGSWSDATLATYAQAYKDTAVELYFDWKDDGKSSQKYILWPDSKSQYWENDANAEKALIKEYKAINDASKNTYVMEMKVQVASNVKTGSNVGWCVMINSHTDPAKPSQEKIAVPTVLNNVNVANKPAEFFSFTLDATEVKLPEAPKASADTFDATLVIMAVAAASGAGFVFTKKKH